LTDSTAKKTAKVLLKVIFPPLKPSQPTEILIFIINVWASSAFNDFST